MNVGGTKMEICTKRARNLAISHDTKAHSGGGPKAADGAQTSIVPYFSKGGASHLDFAFTILRDPMSEAAVMMRNYFGNNEAPTGVLGLKTLHIIRNLFVPGWQDVSGSDSHSIVGAFRRPRPLLAIGLHHDPRLGEAERRNS